ncbi:MAG: multidrug ABC transporter ATP-binding protein, partial [Hyphomicrobiales bacterium]
AGRVRIWDYDIETDTRRARSAIGVVPQEINYDPFFTPAELLELHAGLYGVPAAERRTGEILAALGLADKANAYTRTLSGGMKRRLLVAKALVHAPPILILDEPTAGVDVELRQNLWTYVRQLNSLGTTIVLTTHYLEEAETLCDEIAIIDQGRVIACEPKGKLLTRLDCKKLIIRPERELSGIDDRLRPFEPELLPDGALSLSYRPSKTSTASVLSAIRDAGIEIADITTSEADLEDVFLSLTSRTAGRSR